MTDFSAKASHGPLVLNNYLSGIKLYVRICLFGMIEKSQTKIQLFENQSVAQRLFHINISN